MADDIDEQLKIVQDEMNDIEAKFIEAHGRGELLLASNHLIGMVSLRVRALEIMMKDLSRRVKDLEQRVKPSPNMN